MKALKWLLAATGGIATGLLVVAAILLYTDSGQDRLLPVVLKAGMARQADGVHEDALSVFVCGSASPLQSPDRAQACIAVLTPTHFFVIDVGSGSVRNLRLANLPTRRLDGVLLTHFHSDHIAELYELNLGAWVGGISNGIMVYGGQGVASVVDGINRTYELDRQYRVGHHGAAFLVPATGLLRSTEIGEQLVFEEGDFKVEAFTVSHPPIVPSLGYRITYKDRSVAVTGDTNMTEAVRKSVAGVDLLLADALSPKLIKTMSETAAGLGAKRPAKILADVMEYHAHTDALAPLLASGEIGMLALYHLVPSPQNLLMKNIFMRDMPGEAIMTEDGMWFVLPAASSDIEVVDP